MKEQGIGKVRDGYFHHSVGQLDVENANGTTYPSAAELDRKHRQMNANAYQLAGAMRSSDLRFQGESERRLPMTMSSAATAFIELTVRVKRGPAKGRIKVVNVKQTSEMATRRLTNCHLRELRRDRRQVRCPRVSSF